jgi:hypothetical protein
VYSGAITREKEGDMFAVSWYGDDDQPDPIVNRFETENEAQVFLDALPEDSAAKLYKIDADGIVW